MIGWAWLAARAEMPVTAEFEYRYSESVTGRSGEYEGYADRTDATGTYHLSRTADTVAVTARYHWRYWSSEGKRESGDEDRPTTVDRATRRYTGAAIDLDDEALARVPPGELSTWLWIPPGTEVGAAVPILDMSCVLRERSASPAVGSVHVPALLVVCEGDDERHDDYGDFRFHYVDRYWFEPTTGLFLAEEYEERDDGSLEGRAGRFDVSATVTLTRASYVDVPPPPDVGAACLGCTAGTLGFGMLVSMGLVVGFGGLAWLARRSTALPDQLTGTTFGEVSVTAVADGLALAGLDTTACSQHFQPFLEDFVQRSIEARDPVWIATSADRKLVGLAFWDETARIGTVLCPDAKVALNLVKRFGQKGAGVEFFSEQRHQGPLGPQFNVHETWTVLGRDLDGEPAYDTNTIRRYRAEDRDAVVALLRKEWGDASFASWLDVQIARGDPAFVAVVDGAVVGFALAAVVGTRARFQLSLVDREHRDRGLGGELVRARLTALFRLGVEHVIAEVATWNVASLHVLREHGFTDVGELLVQSTSRTRARRNVIRR
ncbi:MAG: GNAT family N-acetyltransferase [Alphaproteobacteria bacterium]|nr:GNAT family N-acetyltransferase [Alphaproteobacteria bacterium]MCB9699853.1 GNAT family N-acetyltransferase [Alphaproteobacteria bacterium]